MLVPVYDIQNCGPRRRFSANGRLVHNSDKINLQNLPSRGANAKQIKKGIMAPDGYVLIDADSSQIEARVLAWLAEQTDLVDAFFRKEDVYKIMASRIYGKPVTAIDRVERQVGKTVILGAGYGVGHVKLQVFLKTQAGVEVSLDEAKEIIDIYRKTNGQISGLWKAAQKMLEYMVRNKTVRLGRPGVLHVDALYEGIRLPSGMWIRYPDLKREPREDFGYEYHYQARGKSRKYIYGGKVVENVTQALARCIVGEQMLRVAKRYRPILTVHDSIICCVRGEEAREAQAYIENCMRWTPAWAEGLPVNCESEILKRYGGDD